MQEEHNNFKAPIKIPVTLDLSEEHFVFQQPKSRLISQEGGKLEGVQRDMITNLFYATYTPNVSGYQNTIDLEKHSIQIKGTEVPLRNHMFALKKADNGYKLILVKSLISYSQVYENESKVHAGTKLDQAKSRMTSGNKLINLKIE